MMHDMWTARWVLLAVVCAMLTALPAFAQEPLAPTSAPVADDPEAIEKTIRELLPQLKERETGLAALEKLQALRDERVLRVFQRISDRTLYVHEDQIVFVPRFKDDGTAEVFDLFTPLDEEGNPTGKALATVPKVEIERNDFAPQRAVRTQVLNSLRVLGLKVTDPRIRRMAARDLGNKRQLDALPDLRGIADQDPVSTVRREASESIHLIIASGSDPSATAEQKLASVRALGELTSIRALDLLKEQSTSKELSKSDAAVYAQAIKRIERHLSITNWIKNIFFGLSAGSILVLLALGLAITFGLMGVINMAHGEMLMIGAVTTWACYEFISPLLPAAWFDWYYVIALPASFLMAAFVGLLTEVLIVRHLYKRPLDSMLATIGVSYILIQAVRLWKGDNLGMRRPSWFTGGIEIVQDVILPYNRLFIIALTIMCVLGVMALFRYTKIGLMIRATVQNREMAQALGVNTRLVDMFTFALGAGLAGVAGYAIYLLSNPTPEMGQGYVVKSFLVVVTGGVGKLMGVIVSGLGLGFLEKLIEPIVLIEKPLRIFDATWAQVAVLIIVVLFIQRRPGGLFPEKGRLADQADKSSAPFLAQTTLRADLMFGLSLAVLGLVVIPMMYGLGWMSLEYVNKLGYILTFAICAIGLDLIWGYVGVLSLCQFLFFSIGGYAMGLYLINHGPKAADGIPECLSYVMSTVGERTIPWFLKFFTFFPLAVFWGIVLPGLVALLIGITTFRSRVRGVYFAILTQAITVAFWLVFQKNDLKLGGTNGLTMFTEILGFQIAADPNAGAFEQTRFWLYITTVVVLLIAIFIAKALTRSGFGRVLVAVRDDETRLRFAGYQTWAYKALAFTLAAIFAAVGGMLYVPLKGIITPHQIAAKESILVVAWVAVGGRGSLWGSVIGAILVSLIYEQMTSWKPDYWLFVLGALFVMVPLLLPGGLMSAPKVLMSLRARGRERRGFTVMQQPRAVEGSTP